MFDRYNEKARRVIFFARYEASLFGDPYIDTEHLLLGLLREDGPMVASYLSGGADYREIIEDVKRAKPERPQTPTSVDLPITNDGKQVLGYAAEEAERMASRDIGTRHLLLALLRLEESLAARLLRARGLRLPDLRVAMAEEAERGPVARKPVSLIRFVDESGSQYSEHPYTNWVPRIGESMTLEGLFSQSRKYRVVDVAWDTADDHGQLQLRAVTVQLKLEL